MSYWLFTGRQYFGKTHIVAGYGEFLFSACGLKWRHKSNAWKEMKKERVRPVKRTMSGSLWPDLKDLGVTCEHCLRLGYPPYLSRHRSQSLPPEQEEIVGPEGVHREQQGGLDVDLYGG